MRTVLVAAVTTVFVGGLLATAAFAKESAGKAKNPNLGKVRHVVLLKFQNSATPAEIKKVEEAFHALPSKIPSIEGFEFGTNISPENLSQGFTHCFFLTFKDAKARDAYLPHPAHKAFGKTLRPFLDKVLVVDYAVKE